MLNIDEVLQQAANRVIGTMIRHLILGSDRVHDEG